MFIHTKKTKIDNIGRLEMGKRRKRKVLELLLLFLFVLLL